MPSLDLVNLTNYAFSFRNNITISSRCSAFHLSIDIGELARYFAFSVCFERVCAWLDENSQRTTWIIFMDSYRDTWFI